MSAAHSLASHFIDFKALRGYKVAPAAWVNRRSWSLRGRDLNSIALHDINSDFSSECEASNKNF